MMYRETVIRSRVRLARNYDDLPFDLTGHRELADISVARTVNAMKAGGLAGGFDLVRLRDLSEDQQRCLGESQMVSRDLLRTPEISAVLVSEGDMCSVMINEEDHLRIQAFRPALDLRSAAAACFRVDDALSRHVSFAFDEQLGYLTAYPTNTGTGMRASVLMHLPMMTRCKQMGNVGQLVAKLGLNIRGVFGEGSEALGCVYQISNQVTLGRTEEELLNSLTALAHQLSDMEKTLREKTLREGRAPLEDVIFRAWGVMSNARILPLNEFYQHWSNLRLGCAMELLPLPLSAADPMLEAAQPAMLKAAGESPLSDADLDEARASRIRSIIALGGEG